LALISTANAGTLPPPFTEHCIVGEQNLYPPDQPPVKWYTINLNQAPILRWRQVALDYKAQITSMLELIKNLTRPIFGDKLIEYVDTHMDTWNDKLPAPYAEEIRGIATATGLPLGEIVLYNVFYEVFTFCTSIVAEDPSGRLYHARNLDFGLFMGWDPRTHDWMLSNQLRQMVINLDFQRNGKSVYKTVNFAGYVGVYNGVKKDAFTITANERFNIDGGYVGIMKWLRGETDGRWMTFLVRDTLEQANNFEEAKAMLNNTEILSPVYYILGGARSGEGAIITRARESSVDVLSMNLSNENGWYVLETNYDNWKPPLFIDDRRTPGNECMHKLGRADVGFPGLFNVLSSQTTLNKLTVYTVLMQVNDYAMETYIQTCPQPCWAF
jgi:acid ceramidase